MRSLALALASLVLIACAHEAPAPASPSAPPVVASERTRVDHDDLAIELPGKWEERAIDGGYDLRIPDREQVIVSLLPPMGGLDPATLSGELSKAQRTAMSSQCKSGVVASEASASTTPANGTRIHVTCKEPSVVATFVAAPVGGKVLSFEHYRYDGNEYSPDLDRADDAILATLQVKATKAAPSAEPKAEKGGCPSEVLAQMPNGGMCLEPAVMGKKVVDACARALKDHGWARDETTAKLIGNQTGKKLVCYHVTPSSH